MNILVTYASMTGTAEFVAEEIHGQLERMGFCPTLVDMDDLSLEQCQNAQKLILCSSSYGAGDVPSNGHQFYQLLKTEPDLSALEFAIFGLGDGSYVHSFCGAAQKFQAALVASQAREYAPAVFHDCRKDDEPEQRAIEWIKDLFEHIPS